MPRKPPPQQHPDLRLPLQPILDLLHLGLGEEDWQSEMARIAGVTQRNVIRWQTNGITVDRADRLAATLGLHPLNVWGDLWHSELLEEDEAA